MKEIGGYMELDTYRLPMRHEGAVALNCGRNALAYLIEARNIKKICLPRFLCSSVESVCRKMGVVVRYYSVTEEFHPKVPEMQEDEWLYLVNYYGQLSREMLGEIIREHPKAIVDNAQHYFGEPVSGVDTIYTCRKYFGVPDGAFLYTESRLDRELTRDESYTRMGFVLGRYERPASEFYSQSADNNRFFAEEPVKKMSRLTENLLHGIDYEFVRRKREENFHILACALGEKNMLKVRECEGPFMYPFMSEDADRIRKKLLERKIYIPVLWPNVLTECPEDSVEYRLAKNILPLPCDQRYDGDDMGLVLSYVKSTLY